MDVAAFLRGLSLDAYVGEVERHAIDGDMLADLAHCGTLGTVLGMGPLDQTRLRVGLQRQAAASRNKRQAPGGEDAANKRPRGIAGHLTSPDDPDTSARSRDRETGSEKTTAKTAVSPTGFVTFVEPPNAQLECPVSC